MLFVLKLFPNFALADLCYGVLQRETNFAGNRTVR